MEADPNPVRASEAVFEDSGRAETRQIDRVWAYVFSYTLAAVLLGSLIYFSGVWNFLANTRLLSVLINSGVVSYHDALTGFIKGVPDLKYFLKSQDPIKWGLVELAAFLTPEHHHK